MVVEVDPSLVTTVACALRRHFIYSLARSCRLARREVTWVCSGWRKKSSRTKAESATKKGSPDVQWPCCRVVRCHTAEAPPMLLHALMIGCSLVCVAGIVVFKDKIAIDRLISSDIRPLLHRSSYPGILVNSLRSA